MKAKNISVIIADDHLLVLEAIGYALQDRHFQVLATTHSGREALRLVRKHQPNVLVLDLRIPDMNGHQVLKAITQESLPTRVLLLSSSKDPNDIAQAISNGAAGYLSKDLPTEDLRKAILSAASGETVFDREHIDRVLSLDIERAATNSHGLIESLTEQEIRVLLLMSRGMSNPEIASVLSVSPNTIKTHVRHIFEKLNVSDRTSAALWAAEQNLLPEDT